MTTVSAAPADDETHDPTGLITIDTDGGPLRIQLCLSPLCSTIASLLETSERAWWTGPPDGWRRIVARVGRPELAADLACYTRYPALPRFLASRLTDPAPIFADQVEEIRRTPPEQVRRDLDDTFGERLPDAFEEFLTRPDAALDRACDALLAYHDAVIRPRWAEMRPVLTREMLRLAYSLATCGAEAALSSVHRHLAFDGEAVRVGPAGGERSPLGGRLLMLTPLICAPDGIIADIHDERVVKIGYAAPGARQVWSHRPEPAASGR